MTVGEFLKVFTKFAENTPDTLVYFDYCEEGSYPCYFYIKSIRTQRDCIKLECKNRYDNPGNHVYFDALVLLHLLSKVDSSLDLMLAEGDEDEEYLYDIDFTEVIYDGENEICISLPMDYEEG